MKDHVSKMTWLAKRIARRITDDTKANVAIIFALMSLIIILAIATATDFNSGVKAKKELQAALDAAVLEGVKYYGQAGGPALAETNFNVKVSQYKDFNFRVTDYTPNYDASTMTLCVDVTGALDTVFLAIIGMNETEVSVSSCSRVRSAGVDVCFLAMHTTEKHTLELHNVITVYAPGCHIYGNSDHANDVIDPHNDAFVEVIGKGAESSWPEGSLQTVGGGHNGDETNVENLHKNVEVIDNPFPANLVPNRPSTSAPLHNCVITSTSPYPNNCVYSLASLNVTTYNTPVNLDGGSQIQPHGNSMTFNDGLYMPAGGTLTIFPGTTTVRRILTAGTLVVSAGATLQLRDAEVHLDQLVLEDGATLDSTNTIIFLHGAGGSSASCSNGRGGGACEIQTGVGSVLRMRGRTTSNLPVTIGSTDWTGYAIFSRHTPGVYNWAKDFEFRQSVIDIEGCVIAPENFIFWEHTGDHRGISTHQWTCWMVSGVNWRDDGSGTAILPLRFNRSAATNYPSTLGGLIPGSGNGVYKIG